MKYTATATATATATRKPRARAFDSRNHQVTVKVGDTVKTAWGRGRIERIGQGSRLYVRINDPRMFENGRIVSVLTVR